MKKQLMVLALCAGMSFCLMGCASESEDNYESTGMEAPDNEAVEFSNSFETVSAQGSKQYSFEESNVLSFALENRDDSSSDGIKAKFSVVNSGPVDVSNVSVRFSYTDEAGNIICDDGRVNEFGVPSGKSSVVESYAKIDGDYSKSDISNIEVVSYGYRTGDTVFEVDLKSGKSTNRKADVQGPVDFDSANVISFGYDDRGKTSNDAYEIGIEALNNAGKQVSDISVFVAYFDSEGNHLGSDGRSGDHAIESGNFANMKSFLVDSESSNIVSSFGIYRYSYKLSEDDENGFNYYEVNLKTNEAIGRHMD